MIVYRKFARFLIENFNAVLKGDECSFNCPNCGDTKRHFSFNVRLGVSNCFRCGYRPNPFEFLREHTDLTVDEIRELLVRETEEEEETVGVNLEDVIRQYREGIQFPEGSLSIREVNGKVRDVIDRWFCSQNVRMEDISDFRVWIHDTVRIVIPCFDLTGSVLIYWLARALFDNVDAKYLYPGGIMRSAVFWGLERVKVWSDKRLIWVCEGWKDAYRMDGLALLGSHITELQLKILKMVKRWYDANGFIVLLDSDALIKAWDIAKKMVKGDLGEVYFARLYKFKDPGEARDMKEVLENLEMVYVGKSGVIENMSQVLRGFIL